MNALLIVLVDQLSVIFADHFLLDGELVCTDVWNFQQHRRGHVNAVEGLQINMHVRWSLQLGVISIILKMSDTLSKTFFESGSHVHFLK